MRRRDLLRTAAALGGLSLLPGQRSWAKSWGAGPDKTASGLLLPKGVRAEKVLEVFLYGGLGPFESFYVVEEYGRPDDPRFPNEQWHLFASRHEDRLSACGVTDSSLLPFATDALGMKVKLSPWLAPLRARPDMLSRMRILVQRHDLEPHEAAIPIALSGMRLGSARLCGLGAHVQRYHQERDHSARRVPFSYVLYPDTEISTDNLSCASAVGLHPGASRPLDLRITAESELPAQLAREILGDRREANDALLAHYALAAQTRYSADGVMVRSSGLNDHSFALEALRDANALRALFPDELLARQPNKVCGSQNDIDTTRMGLNMAAHLLTHPVVPARYVNVVDGGLIPATGGGGYDTHTDHLKDQSRNLSSMLKSLVSITNEPGEMDPSKIDLDETLIVLNTEFGRTPFVQQGSGDGTNHHPYGYVTVLIGGPIGEEQAGVVGAIGPTAWADRYVTPIESRAAVLAAMGIYPFTQESFAIGDLRDQHVEKDGLAWLNEIVLGRRA